MEKNCPLGKPLALPLPNLSGLKPLKIAANPTKAKVCPIAEGNGIWFATNQSATTKHE
jgi:hypothetical protein